MNTSKKTITLLSLLILLLVLAATSTGVFYLTDEDSFDFVTVRGDTVTIRGSGLYKYDPKSLASEAVAWDTVNLAVGLPLLLVSIYLFNKNSLRGKLSLTGLLFYFSYVYLMYAVMVAYNQLFLVYTAIFSLSLITLILSLQHIEIHKLPSMVSKRFPRRAISVFVIAFGGVLLLLWLGRIVPSISSNSIPVGFEGLTTLPTQALDLGLIVPLALSSGILLWKRSAWGYFLSSIAITMGFMMFLAIPAMIVGPLLIGAHVNLIEIGVMAFFALVGLFFAGLFYRNIAGPKPF